jgi:hypothetical protein
MRKYLSSGIVNIEETDRYPNRDECWLGDHKFSEEELDNPLWIVRVRYGDGEEKGKWGCEKCAQAILKSHPELQNA